MPIAISAVSGEQMANSGASDIRQLVQISPSLFVTNAGADGASAARIRNIGTVGENVGLEASVATFVDGVYRSRSGTALNELGAIDRIEVVRGPQGTLSGRNSTAGLISIYTRRPEYEFEATGEITYGNYDYFRVGGSVTGPIVADRLAGRLDVIYQRRDGTIEDVDGARDYNNRNRFLVRGQMLWEPNDDLTIRLIGDYSEREEACCAAVYTAPFRTLSRNAAGQVVESPNLVLGILRDLGGTVPVGDPFVRQNSLTPGIDLTSPSTDWGLSAEVNWDLGPANLTSITAYRDWISDQQPGFRFRHSGHRPASRLRSRLRDVQPGTEAAGQRVRWRPRLARRGLLCERDDRAGRLPQARRGRGAILQLRRRQGRCARADLQSRGADMLECASGSLPRLSGFCRPSGRVAAAEYRLGQ